VDAKVAYWTAVWINMVGIVALTALGLARAHHGRFAEHRRWMLAGSWLVVLFLASYAGKLWFLGREALGSWSPQFVWVLRVHELCIAIMLAGGLTSLIQAWRLDLAAVGRGRPDAERLRGIRLHRRAGKLAFGAALCGVATAAYVLYGMYQRLA
jgi:uncharacterized membrane protein YozB (DUF420 family)